VNYGRYEILREVGRGSMGVVYEARDPRIDRVVALKVLRPDRVSTDTFVKRFLKEAKVIGRLSHPHIVTIHDVGEDQGNIYIAMEFLEGSSFSDVIRERRLSIKEIVDFGIQIAETLDYAHRKGVVHRDIKPSNIIVQQDGWTKVTDFGIAHLDDASGTLQTQTGEIMGTPAYMSPEQVMGKPVDGRSDLFSLGVILYELCTGARPFGGEGKNLPTVFNEIIQAAPAEPDPTTGIPSELSRVIMKSLRKDPEQRYQTGREMADAMKAALAGEVPAGEAAAPVVTPPVATAPAAQAKNKSRIVPLLAVAAGVFLLGGVAVAWYQGWIALPSLPFLKGDTTTTVAKTEPPLSPPGPGKQPKNPEPILTPESSSRGKEAPPAEKAEDVTPPPAERKSEPEKAEPAVATATLRVLSSPGGARVFVDGAPKGTTPLTLAVPLGAHRVRLSLSGYRDAVRQLSAKKAAQYPLRFALKPLARKPAGKEPSGAVEMKPPGPGPVEPKPPRPRPVEPKPPRQSDEWIIKPLQDRPK
jgi:serine/threonine-protein kinase